MSTEKERVNIYFDPEIKRRVKQEADKIGITMSGFINVCVKEYIYQHDAMDVMKIADKLNEMLEKAGQPAPDAGRG